MATPRKRLASRRGAVQQRKNLLPLVASIVLATAASLLIWGVLHVVDESSLQQNESSSLVSSLETSVQQPNNVPPKPIATIAYAISLIKCGDFQSSAVGMSDAAVILRHSVHETSWPHSSKYAYKMYAIVHSQARHCAQPLADAGYELVIRDAPVAKQEIKGEYLRAHIHKEWCCGADEFIKLYAYTLDEHPIVVHVDVDFVFLRPMDDLFDSMLFDSDSEISRKARERIPLERPNDPWPDRVDAYMTRDWPQVMPGRKALFQAGFLVTRPNRTVLEMALDIIRKGNYVEGFSRQNGWGGMGYGGLVGAMAAQGLMAYLYDVHLNHTWMELNQCRFNHMGMDVLYRSQPSFRPRHAKKGHCRNNGDSCEDCMHTALEQIYNIHYTQCRKPWNCIGVGDHEPGATKQSIPEDSVHLDHCMELLTVWHSYRTDLENKLVKLTADETIRQGQVGDYKKDVFQGHCKGNGGSEYIPLTGKPETLKRLPQLYL